ncbi:MAG: cysteine desulfurase family protein [Fusicatenibacter sp.]|nr:cysteine desulfurase [Fusicatenibacter sp.]
MEAYLDNSATTAVYEQTADLIRHLMLTDYGNPSAMHRKGVEAEQYIREAKETLAKILKVQEREIYFTSGGTESDNWALVGTALANRRTGNHIITTVIEHPAVSAPVQFLEEEGFSVTRLSVDRQGLIDLQELRKAIRPDTILVSVMYVNNEIGAVEPIDEIAKIIKETNPKTYFHVDAIQAFGKYRIYPKRQGIDLLSVSGHKIHGPKGSGFLYIDDNVKIRPMILGGGQQNGMRSGTDNVPGAAGLAKSAAIVYDHLDESVEQMRTCKRRLIEGLQALDRVVIHGMETEQGAPQIVNASFLGVRSEVLLHTLEDRGIYVSAGSACSSHKRAQSPTLTAIHASKAELESAVRFSFCELTTLEEIDYTLEVLSEVLPMLRRFTRR